MAQIDKDIVITPNKGNVADPQIVFSGANANVAAQSITLSVLPASNGTMSFSGSAGQLFSITNSLSGTIFSVNNVSGIPSIEVFANGVVSLAPYGGNVSITGPLTANVIYSNTYPTVLDDISPQFDNVDAVFRLTNNTANVTTITDSKNLQVVVGGQVLEPYVQQIKFPFFPEYDSGRGFRVRNSPPGTGNVVVGSNVIIYNSPAVGSSCSLTIINNSAAVQTRRYPFAPETIACEVD
jgi:hypothetical protein